MTDGQDNQQPGLRSLANIIDVMQGELFPEYQIAPEEAQAVSKRPTKEPRQSSAKLVKAAAEITRRPDKAEIAYIARHIVQCTLPRIDPGEKSVFIRRDGNVSLVMEARTDPKTMKKRGLPSGSIAKIIFLWINTEAVYNKNSPDVHNKYRLVLGKTFNEFIIKLGLDPNTGRGKYSHAKSIKDELMKLLLCLFSLYRDGAGENFVDIRIAKEVHLWWDEKEPGQAAFFESEIILDQDFFEAITSAPVPVDMRVVVALVRSPLAIDLYAWLTYRIHTAINAGQKEIKVLIIALMQQLGNEYNRVDNFKAAIAKALAKIKKLCPTLDYTLDSKMLTIRVGKMQSFIASRGVKRRNPVLDVPNKLSPQMREQFCKSYRLHNVDEVFVEFDDWRTKKGITSQNTDAHFWDFVINHKFKK